MLFKMFLRSFLLQAGWNYERFQNLGFAFALQPALEKAYAGGDRLKAALLRHLEIFNTQPYMASFVLGNVARMEERAAAGDQDMVKHLPGVKQALASSFASIGDRIFWGRLKPMTVQLCLLVWAGCGFYGWLFTDMTETPAFGVLLAGPLSGIAVYSVFSVYIRWKGLKAGYACGGSANCALDAANWPRLIRLLSAAGFAMSLAIVLLAFGLLAGFNCGACRPADLLLKIGLPIAVLALHRVARAFGRSVFFSAGLILAASVLLFGLLKLEPFKLYL
ncbi:MAG: PTS system mannose/fructose/sorbose family transporter subunit IID [Elusimicrobiales bacterium]|nr:PTS system mannose/fructose/sorbose family transporter subunit IID [Elusimicrobiales bacterium]